MKLYSLENIRRNKYLLFFPVMIFFIIIYYLLFIYSYVAHEHRIYCWDTAGYFYCWCDFTFNLGNIWTSIRYSDYNVLPVLLLQLGKFFPFPDRIDYILSILFFYLVPISVIYCIFLSTFTKSDSILYSFLVFFGIATFLPFLGPILRGYPDIGSIFFIILTLTLVNLTSFKNTHVVLAIFVGIFLYCIFLLRRYYAYSLISLYLSLPIYCFFKEEKSKESIKPIIYFFIISAISTGILLLIFQYPLAKRILSTNYSHIYTAYAATSLSYLIKGICSRIGYIYLFLYLYSTIIILLSKDKKFIILLAFCTFNIIFTLAIFNLTQAPGMHHLLPINAFLIIIILLGIHITFNRLKYKNIIYFSLIISTLSLPIILYLYKIPVYPYLNFQRPLTIQNYNNYLSLCTEINSLIGDNKKISVIGSSTIFNDSLINTICERKFSKQINWMSQIDLRDGLKLNFLDSDFLLVADPPQTHAPQGTQRVITIPAETILKGTTIGKSYRRRPEKFNLARGITCYVYEKINDISPEEKAEFLKEFYKYYPEWEK